MNPSIIYLWHFAEERVVQKAANYHIVFWRTRFKTASFFYFFVFPPYSCRAVRTPSRPYTLKIKNRTESGRSTTCVTHIQMKRSHHTLKLCESLIPRPLLYTPTSDICRFQTSYNRLVSNFSTTRTTAWKSSIFFASEKVLTHTDSAGNAKMIDISGKETTSRVAVATSRVSLGAAAFELVLKNKVEKGDVLAVAKIAGINAAKQTHLLIPLCHSIMLSDIEIHLLLNQELHAIDIRSTVKTMGQTGVEMEALVGASVSSLAVYDMCKGVSKGITIEYTRLEEKTGGASGAYSRSV